MTDAPKDKGLIATKTDLPDGYWRVERGLAMRLEYPEGLRQEVLSRAAARIEDDARHLFGSDDAVRAGYLAGAGAVRQFAAWCLEAAQHEANREARAGL